ncbi:MAG: pirin family protein [Fibrobacterota bacterium]
MKPREKQQHTLLNKPAEHWVGNGFCVRSLFSYPVVGDTISPFLLMDYAQPRRFPPTAEKKGVGEHPHRGFETVTIAYEGEIAHRDSSGGGGTIRTGDVQWMTAGAGIVHEEFHSPAFAQRGGTMKMVQFWVNLPRSKKRIPAAYQAIRRAAIPQKNLPRDAGSLRIIAGDYLGATGPAATQSPMNVFDLRLHTSQPLSVKIPSGHIGILAVLSGEIDTGSTTLSECETALYDEQGDHISLTAARHAHALLLSGIPFHEPLAGGGPFVMNTNEEIRQAFEDYHNGKMGHLE